MLPLATLEQINPRHNAAQHQSLVWLLRQVFYTGTQARCERSSEVHIVAVAVCLTVLQLRYVLFSRKVSSPLSQHQPASEQT